jgi:hypothetical protein
MFLDINRSHDLILQCMNPRVESGMSIPKIFRAASWLGECDTGCMVDVGYKKHRAESKIFSTRV